MQRGMDADEPTCFTPVLHLICQVGEALGGAVDVEQDPEWASVSDVSMSENDNTTMQQVPTPGMADVTDQSGGPSEESTSDAQAQNDGTPSSGKTTEENSGRDSCEPVQKQNEGVASVPMATSSPDRDSGADMTDISGEQTQSGSPGEVTMATAAGRRLETMSSSSGRWTMTTTDAIAHCSTSATPSTVGSQSGESPTGKQHQEVIGGHVVIAGPGVIPSFFTDEDTTGF